ncbi:MAG: hypothetical protein ACM3QU_05715 [Verrucomicrobiota bacterium]
MTDEPVHPEELDVAWTYASVADAADQLREFSEFRDRGLVSTEEFDTMTAELFARTRLL